MELRGRIGKGDGLAISPGELTTAWVGNPARFPRISSFSDITYSQQHPCGPSPYRGVVQEPSGTTVVDHHLRPKCITTL